MDKSYDFYNILVSCKTTANLKFVKKIKENNAQGACGIMTIKQASDKEPETMDCREIVCPKKTSKVFYKYGNNGYNNVLGRQEFVVANQLLFECSHLPNFLRPVAYIKNHMVRNDKCEDPFAIDDANKDDLKCVDVVILEHLEYRHSLLKLIKTDNKKLINSVFVQTCLAIICAQQNCNFVHNDLHANNVVTLKCEKSLVFLYRMKILGEEKLYAVETEGEIPVIIDYGFSWSNDCENMSLECADSDNYGLITYKYDSISDFIRFFIVILSSDVDPKLSHKLRRMFLDLPVSMKNSWEKIVGFESSKKSEDIFVEASGIKDKNLAVQMSRLLMRGILLPLKDNSETGDLSESIELMMEEWTNVEMWLKHECEKILVFRETIDSYRKHKNYQILGKEVHENVKRITGKEIPMNVNWEKFYKNIDRSVKLIEKDIYNKTKSLAKKRERLLYRRLISGERMFKEILPYLKKNRSVIVAEHAPIVLIDNIEKYNAIIKMDKPGKYYPEEIYEKFLKNQQTC